VSWPADREPFIIHVAAEAAEETDSPGSLVVRLVQRCSRCGVKLHRGNTGAPPPWAPGVRVAVSQSGQVRMSVQGPTSYPDCVQAADVPAAA
jgi:hypothetical protein